MSTLPLRPMDDAAAAAAAGIARAGAIVKQVGAAADVPASPAGQEADHRPGMLPASTAAVPAAALGLLPDAGTFDSGTFLKGAANELDLPSARRATSRGIAAWADWVGASGGEREPAVPGVRPAAGRAAARRGAPVGPGPSWCPTGQPKVYFVNGTDQLIPVNSWVAGADDHRRRAWSTAGDRRRSRRRTQVRPGGSRPRSIAAVDQRYLGLGRKVYSGRGGRRGGVQPGVHEPWTRWPAAPCRRVGTSPGSCALTTGPSTTSRTGTKRPIAPCSVHRPGGRTSHPGLGHAWRSSPRALCSVQAPRRRGSVASGRLPRATAPSTRAVSGTHRGGRQTAAQPAPGTPAAPRVTGLPGTTGSTLLAASAMVQITSPLVTAGADLGGQPGHRSRLVRGDRLLHLHRLEDDDQVAGGRPGRRPRRRP